MLSLCERNCWINLGVFDCRGEWSVDVEGGGQRELVYEYSVLVRD